MQLKDNCIVKNKLLRFEHLEYCLAWRNLINPNRRNINVMYRAIGPDLATVLLTTDATKIVGIDTHPPTFKRMKKVIRNFDNLENPNYLKNFTSDELKLRFDYNYDFLKTVFKNDIRRRRIDSYWDCRVIESWSIDRCLGIELKKLGLKKDEVKLDERKGDLFLTFNWGLTPEEVKERGVHYVKFFRSSFDTNNKIDLASFNGFYEKCSIGADYRNFFEVITDEFKVGSFVLTGSFGQTRIAQIKNKLQRRYFLGQDFEKIEIDDKYAAAMIEVRKRSPPFEKYYGWELDGMKRVRKA
ncbi:hypothetical protein J4408_04370 [Candidatus Pacearchaeota archaeon]|nr:hypothetical protein [Candidatus Pacearchaeota archaeon]